MIQLADFGLSDQLNHSWSRRTAQAGTPLYWAPEVFSREGKSGAGLKSDIWALGITLIELAERKEPYHGLGREAVLYKIIYGEPSALPSSRWSRDFVDFVSKCLMKDENTRWKATQLIDVRSALKSNE